MKIPLHMTFVAVCALMLLYSRTTVLAVNDFNPNYLISDDEMQDWQSMSRPDIQAFLRDKGGLIAGLKTQDKEGMERTVADIILRASLEHKINPKYLLVKLQKEQSLVTDTDPTQKQLDGATGYGITDGCGWSCATYLNNQGFGKQVDSAAGIIRWYYDHVDSEAWIKKIHTTYTIDNESITPVTLATAFLYTYTPHLQGNKNFWTLWQTWFDQVYPNGSLLKTNGSPTVYLIKDTRRYAFTSFVALSTRYDPKNILTVPESEIGRYPLGPDISIPNYSILKNNTAYYLLDNESLRQFATHDLVRELGYNPDEILEVNADDLQAFSPGDPIVSAIAPVLGRVVKMKEDDNYYYVDNEQILHPLLDAHIASINFPHLSVEKVSGADFTNPVIGNPIHFKDGTLILIEGSSKVYVISEGKKRHIASEQVFNELGYKWENIVRTNSYVEMLHPSGEAIYLRSAAAPENFGSTVPADTSANIPDTIQSDSGAPVNDLADLMVTVPENETVTIGTVFSTGINTYLVADPETQEILVGKNIDAIRPIASLTKVMTANLLRQKGVSLTNATEYDPDEHKPMYPGYRIAPGEAVLNSDLFDAFLVSSLNTPGRMLVDSVEQDEATFIANMNALAQEWNLPHTHFADVTGENTASVSTAKEYMDIFLRSITNKRIIETLAKPYYEYSEQLDLDGKPDHFDYHSNALVNTTGLPYTILASKTGYLNEAGSCLTMLIERPSDGKRFLVITMGNPDYNNRFDEPNRLAAWVVNQL